MVSKVTLIRVKPSDKEKVKTKLLRFINIHPHTGCWEWQRARQKRGYGIFKLTGVATVAHRVSAYVYLGLEPRSKLNVCHKCDNPPCCNPDHLFISTQKDNVRDMFIKGRSNHAHHESVNTAKLTKEKVIEIRKLRSNTGLPFAHIAKRFGVCPENISQICKGRTWKNLPL